MIGRYNRLAYFYDTLSTIVYGGRIQRANSQFISSIQTDSEILIIGGGTGKILEKLPANCSVDYVDFSGKMIDLAKRRKTSAQVDFHQVDFFEFEGSKKYDFVLCPFFLDQFNEEELNRILTKILSSIKDKGHLLVSDFYPPKPVFCDPRNGILGLTICFFRYSTRLTINNLEDIQYHLKQNGFKLSQEKKHFFGMIFSSKWITDRH